MVFQEDLKVSNPLRDSTNLRSELLFNEWDYSNMFSSLEQEFGLGKGRLTRDVDADNIQTFRDVVVVVGYASGGS